MQEKLNSPLDNVVRSWLGRGAGGSRDGSGGVPGTYKKGGNAIAEIFYGYYNPSGRLTVIFANDEGQEPMYYNHPLLIRELDFYDCSCQYVAEPEEFRLTLGPSCAEGLETTFYENG